MLKHRLILGPLMIVALIAMLWLDEQLDRTAMPAWAASRWPGNFTTWPPNLVLFPVCLLLVILAARELAAMFKAEGIMASRRWLGMSAALGLCVSVIVPAKSSPVDAVALVASAATAVLITSLLWHIRDKTLSGATAAAGATAFAFIYLGLMAGFILALRRDQSAWAILGVLIVTKSCDIGAFFAGKAFGKHKLIPWLSPGKTWEGLFGGAILSALVCVGVAWFAKQMVLPKNARPMGFANLEHWQAALLGVLFGVIGQAGDLFESVLKRDAGMKDSGKTVPGFGGVLDVVDSILLVAPLAYWILTRV